MFRSARLAASSAFLVLLVPWSAPADKPARAAASSAAATAGQTVEIKFEKYRLGNGLEVILHEDHSLPFVAVNIWYHVGPANEPKGRSGFAHLFEHLMFEGSRYAGTEFDHRLESAGATNVNGTTSWDRTNYYETVPREHLELVLWLESDRMGFMPSILTLERLDVQRQVVQNERRQTYENAPYGPSQLALLNGLFPQGHPYHGAVIGSMRDIAAATLQDVQRFFDKFYAPANATLAIAGDFQTDTTKQLVERYFGSLSARGGPRAFPKRIPSAALKSAKRVVVREPVELGQVMMGWVTPPAYTDDNAALDVATTLLGDGKTARLYRELLIEKRLASEVNAWVDSNQLASSVVTSAVAASGKKLQELESAMNGVVRELSESGPTKEELHRAKRKIMVGVLSDLQLLNGSSGENGRAGILQRMNRYLGDPGALGSWLSRIESVSAADVQRVIKVHLKPSACLTIVTEPAGKGS